MGGRLTHVYASETMVAIRCSCGQFFETEEQTRAAMYECKACHKDSITPELQTQKRVMPRPLVDPLLGAATISACGDYPATFSYFWFSARWGPPCRLSHG